MPIEKDCIFAIICPSYAVFRGLLCLLRKWFSGLVSKLLSILARARDGSEPFSECVGTMFGSYSFGRQYLRGMSMGIRDFYGLFEIDGRSLCRL